MIENELKAGMRLLWDKPLDGCSPTRDGSFKASHRTAKVINFDGVDPKAQFVGMEQLRQELRVSGSPKPGDEIAAHDWLDYVAGRVTFRPLSGIDVLTGFMSGCLVARGTYLGTRSVFHVGTDGMDMTNTKAVKDFFGENMPEDTEAFNPAAAWEDGEIANLRHVLGERSVANPKFFGLATSNLAFYAVLLFEVWEFRESKHERPESLYQVKMPEHLKGKENSARPVTITTEGNKIVSEPKNKDGQGYWCVGDIRQVKPMNREETKAALLKISHTVPWTQACVIM